MKCQGKGSWRAFLLWGLSGLAMGTTGGEATGGKRTRSPRNLSPATQTRPPSSIPPTPSPLPTTLRAVPATPIRAGGPHLSGPLAPPKVRREVRKTPLPYSKPHPTRPLLAPPFRPAHILLGDPARRRALEFPFPYLHQMGQWYLVPVVSGQLKPEVVYLPEIWHLMGLEKPHRLELGVPRSHPHLNPASGRGDERRADGLLPAHGLLLSLRLGPVRPPV